MKQITAKLKGTTAVRLVYWALRRCPQGHGCPPTLRGILGGGGGC